MAESKERSGKVPVELLLVAGAMGLGIVIVALKFLGVI